MTRIQVQSGGESSPTAKGQEMEKVENPLTVEQAVGLVGLMYVSAREDYEEAQAKYDNSTYDEEYEDTLERKYNEGQADAFRTALDYFERASGEYQRGFDEGEKEGGINVLSYLSDLYEGVDETDIWADYMEEEEEKHPIYCPVCGSVGCVIDHDQDTNNVCARCEEVLESETALNYHKEFYCEEKERTCNLCGDEILDLELGAIVSPFGECCGKCVNEIKGAK